MNKYLKIGGVVAVLVLVAVAISSFSGKNEVVIQKSDAVHNKTYNSELGFSFEYPDYLFVSVDPENPDRVMILPNSMKTNENEPLTAIFISTSQNPPETPKEWMAGPDSGYDMAGGYKEIEIDGEKAITVEDGTWIVVNTPDMKRRLSIALLADKYNKDNGEPLISEEAIIIDSLKFNR